MSDVRLTATNPDDSSVVPVACNAKGELLLAEDSGGDYVQLDDGGTKQVIQSGGLGISDGTNENITLKPDGSALFATNVGIGPAGTVGTLYKLVLADGRAIFSANDEVFGLGLAFNGETSPMFLGSPGLNEFQISYPSGLVAFKVGVEGLEYYGGNAGQLTFDIDTSGDATFTGSVTIGKNGSTKTLTVTSGGSFAGDVVVGSRGKQWMIVESGGIAHLVDQSLVATQLAEDSEDLRSVIVYPKLRNIPQELTMVEEQLQKVMERLRMVPEAGWEVWDGEE